MKCIERYLTVAWLIFAGGCVSDRVVELKAIDGSNDHRIFRIASLTKLMMEPVLWKLEDTHKIDFDCSVRRYFHDDLPEEYEQVTLRMLHDNRSGLPREFIDPWCLGDVYSAFKCGCVGSNLYEGFDTREEFVGKLRTVWVREMVRRGEPEYSNMGYALMMMAICDYLKTDPQHLIEEYLIKPYGLKDTSFVVTDGMKSRLTPCCAGHLPWWRFKGMEVPDHREGVVTLYTGGMLSSASDLLKIGFVLLPHLDRASGLLKEHRYSAAHTILYRTGMIYGGHAFIGFDRKNGRVGVILRNETCWPNDDGLELMEDVVFNFRIFE